MAELSPRVRQATEADHEAASEALALAFADDPAWAHLMPNPETRAEQLLALFKIELENQDPDHHQVWIAEDGSGAAIWASPGHWRASPSQMLRSTRQLAAVFGRRLALAIWALARLERHHPGKPAHWYLHYLGVEPRRQGHGLGGALLAPMLEVCDRERIPAYLESSTERNRVLYERNGFSFTGSFDMPAGGPPIREMWRDPT